jgi:hypothetical protein
MLTIRGKCHPLADHTSRTVSRGQAGNVAALSNG